MKGSSLLIMYVVALAVFFVILVVLTIVLIATRTNKKKQNKKSGQEHSEHGEHTEHSEHSEHGEHRRSDTKDHEEIDMSETRLEDVVGQPMVSNNELSDEDFAFMDSAFGMLEEEETEDVFGNTELENEISNESEAEDFARDVKNTLGNILDEDASKSNNNIDSNIEQVGTLNIDTEESEYNKSIDVNIDEQAQMSDTNVNDEEEISEEYPEEPVVEENQEYSEEPVDEESQEYPEEPMDEVNQEYPEEPVDEVNQEYPEEPVDEVNQEYPEEPMDEINQEYQEAAVTSEIIPPDSAFAPEPEIENTIMGMSNEEINASVKEAVALGEAVSGREIMFGLEDEFRSKKERKKSTVSSDEEFFWYNKLDVMEKPAYKTAEMYYHYFNIAGDCIEDLLIEMYDCALVRTEEIRYIAYGIEPRAVSMKEILTSSGSYSETGKIKEPTTQDLVKIYEKWCGYVDKLFDIIEVHADEYTINEIRNSLCAFGRNDVEVLLEGK